MDTLIVESEDNSKQCVASVQPLANILKMSFEKPYDSHFEEAV